MKVFFDTNVLVSAFATSGLCAELFAHVLLEHEIVVGEVVIAELRAKLTRRIRVPKTIVDEIEALLRESTVVARPRKHLDLKIGDPDDEWVVASAAAGGAEVLVTGDRAVLAIGRRAPLRIVSPRGLWALLRASKPEE